MRNAVSKKACKYDEKDVENLDGNDNRHISERESGGSIFNPTGVFFLFC